MNRAALLKSTEDHEGFSEHPYRDTLRLWTIGIGRCLQTNPLTANEWAYLLDNAHLSVAITHGGATWLMERQIDRTANELAAELRAWPGLSDTAQNVLVEMAFQMGVPRLLGFRKMLALISAHDYTSAAAEGLNSEWAKQTPKRAQELMRRLEKA